MKSRSKSRPLAIVDDLAVPPDRLAAVVRQLQDRLKRHGVMWTMNAYAGDGRIRLRPFLDLADPGDRARLEPLAREIYDLVFEAGGTISASQGCGLARTQFLPRQYGELVQVFREIKDAFDPSNLLNPGKVVGDDPHLMVRDLKHFPTLPLALDSRFGVSRSSLARRRAQVLFVSWKPSSGRSRVGESGSAAREHEVPAGDCSVILPVLRWPEPGALAMASACHGCGECRNLDPTLRMCPSYRAHRREAATPRSQANLIRQIATGQVDPKLWGSEEFKAHAGLCIHCKLCQPECPAGVDVSSLMLEAKAAFVENHGLPPGDWVFSRLEMWARLASRFPIISNFLMSRRSARWLIERVLGGLPASGAAPGPAHSVHSQGAAAGARPTAASSVWPARGLLRRRLRQLL